MDNLFDDILEVPAVNKARPALSKFQPKVKGVPKKGPSASHPTKPPKVSGEENVSQTTIISAVTKSLGTVPSGDDLLPDPRTSSISEIPDDVVMIKTPPELVSLQLDMENVDVPRSEIAMSDIIVEESLGFGNITAETDPTGFERYPVGKLLPVPATQDIAGINEALHSQMSGGITVTQDMVSCRQDALSAGVEFQIDNNRAESQEHDNLGEHDIVRESLDSFPERISASGFGQIREELLPDVEIENGREKLSDEIPHPAAESIERLDSHLVHPGNERNNEEFVPASADDDIIDYSALGFDYSTYDPNDTNLFEPSQHAANAQDVHAGVAPDVDGSLAKSTAVRVNKRVRQPKKRIADEQLVDGSDNRAHDDGSFSDEVHSYSNADEIEHDNDDREQGSLKKKKRVARKRKGDSKSVETTEKPRRKFSHSTRRTRRRVNESLLQIPEDEIDCKKLKIKDLILLAEHKERLAKKNAAPNSQPSTQSADKPSQGDFVNHEDEIAASEGEGSPRQAGATVQPSLPLFNYQSYMNKTPTTRWSKQDTELFYEGVRQFGTDLMMIKELFPNLTRHQIKLKYKKEERQNPLRLSEALADRAGDHSHFQLVIERLQAASQLEKGSNLDPSVGTTGKEDAGDPASRMNDEVTKPEEDTAGGSPKKDDAGGRDAEGEGEIHCSAKSDGNGEDDIFQILSSYQSEL